MQVSELKRQKGTNEYQQTCYEFVKGKRDLQLMTIYQMTLSTYQPTAWLCMLFFPYHFFLSPFLCFIVQALYTLRCSFRFVSTALHIFWELSVPNKDT